ncbi:thiamine diphosphokinase [Nitratireductor luteus]|uniref:thiamine diphosphokinase n=1 Tax=Nitratireductor luteus TaxID=2976980 RepID=UPI00223EB761|nr:thiamine diphosphokinase [Nitratireductor luteus]
MSRFAILLGGDVHRTPELDAQLSGSRVFAADSGMRHAAVLELAPELWLGDFDSTSDELLKQFPGTPREIYPPDKDKTDGELAIDTALAAGASELVLVGAFGGERPDHAFLHMTLALQLAERGVSVFLTSGAQEGQALLPGVRHEFDYGEGTLFSILAFGELAGLTVEGAKWPLNDVVVPFGSSLTISNEVRGSLSVRLEVGRALLVAHLVTEGER